MQKILISGLLSFVFFTVSAQSWEVGGFIGGSGYMGDLNPVKPYKLTNMAFGGQLKRNLDGYLALKLGLLKGKIMANDAKSENLQFQQRNLSFFTPLTEVSAQAEFNFFRYVPTISDKIYTPYLFTGISYTFFNPKTVYDGNTYELNLYGTEGQTFSDSYKKEILAIPYGAGVKYNISGKWNLIGEIGFRTAFTDYLDDVSGKYPDKSIMTDPVSVALSDRSGETTGVYVGATGTQRGDFRKRDTYMFAGISLTYTFITPKCYVFK